MMSRYLITGGTGFVGSHLVEALLEKKVDPRHITLLVRPTSALTNIPNQPFHILRGDIRDPKLVQQAVNNVDMVYHLAATSGFQGSTDEDYLSTNVRGTQILLGALRKKRIRKFLFVSTIAVYGLPAWVGPIIRYDETHPHSYSEIYGRSKEEAEQAVMRAHSQWGLPVSIVRPSSVYGPRDTGQLYELCKAIDHNYFIMIGDGKNVMDLVYVRDLVRGIIQAAESRKKMSEYIISGSTPTLTQVVNAIASQLHVTRLNISIPRPIALPISWIAEQSFGLVGKRSPLFPSRVKVLTTSYSYTYDKAKKELGYEPTTTYLQGIRHMATWYKTGRIL